MPNSFTYSDTGLALTRRWEGLVLTAYQDQVGVWTVGYGHTGRGVTPGLTITQADAEGFLVDDIARAASAVNRLVTAAISQNQFDAMVDFSFNLGVAAFSGSTLLRMVNSGNLEGAVTQFPLWSHAGGVVNKGLAARRADEAALFTGNYQPPA